MPRLWSGLALALLVLGGYVLASTTLLDSLEQEVAERAGAEPQGQPQIGPGDARNGLPVTEFLLLDPTSLDTASATPQGRTLTLGAASQLDLPVGTRVQFGSMPMPVAGVLTLAGPARFDGRTIDVAGGGTLELGGSTVLLGPGSRVTLPSTARIALEPGAVPAGRQVTVYAGSIIELPPVTMEKDTVIDLGPGVRLILDAGTWAPLLSKDPVPVPALTTVLGPPGGKAVAGTGQFGVVPPDEADPGTTQRGRPVNEVATVIDITQYPVDGVDKGVPFTVGGSVRYRTGGDGVADHPVVLYANASKDAPGTELGRARTGPDGSWSIVASLAPGMPARPYHLVAHALARPDVSPPLGESWSDPIVGVRGDTHLALHAPDVEGRNVPIAIRALLTDRFGAPVPDQDVAFAATGYPSFHVATNEEGEAVLTLDHGYFTPGTYQLAAAFEGDEHLGRSENRTDIRIVDAAILTEPEVEVVRGDTLTLAGRLVAGTEAAGRLQIQGTLEGSGGAGDVTVFALTDEEGAFELAVPVPALARVGTTTLTLEEPTRYHATRTVIVHVLGRAVLDVSAPPLAPLGGRVPVLVTVTDELAKPLPGARVRVSWPGAEEVVTSDAAGAALARVPATRAGELTIAARVVRAEGYVGGESSTSLLAGDFGVRGVPRIVLGEPADFVVDLEVAGEALNTPQVYVSVGGSTLSGDARQDGRASFHGDAPVAGPQPGLHDVPVILPEFDHSASFAAAFVERPMLRLDAPGSTAAGDAMPVGVRVLSKAGPLTGIPVALSGSGAADFLYSAPTGPDGVARFDVDVPGGADGELTLVASVADTDSTASAQASAVVPVRGGGFPWTLALLGLVPLALVAVGGAAVVAVRRRHATEPAAPLTQVVRRPVGIELRLAPQREGLPPVWHADEPVRLLIETKAPTGAPLANARVVIDGPEGPVQGTTDAHGRAEAVLTFRRAGASIVRARFAGVRHRGDDATLEVRVVHYREEIEREYNALRDRLVARGALTAAAGGSATPREIERALGGGAAAAECIRVFEIADYSTHRVSRREYETFMRSKERAERRGG